MMLTFKKKNLIVQKSHLKMLGVHFLEFIKIKINQKKKEKKVNNGLENYNNKQRKKIKEKKYLNKIRI